MKKLIEVTNSHERDACVALMCAEVYGHKAGLKPLLHYTEVMKSLLPNFAARVVALAEGDKLLSTALLVVEEQGKAVSLELIATPGHLRGKGYARELLERLTQTTAMRVETSDPYLEGFFTTFGFSRWSDKPGAKNTRIGVNERYPLKDSDSMDELVTVDENVIIRNFKRDAASFEYYTQRFVDGVERSKEYFA